jgi:hypothetical protein
MLQVLPTWLGGHTRIGPPSAIIGGKLMLQVLPTWLGGHTRIGPPSATEPGREFAATKVPANPTVSATILIASFAFIFTCMVVLLLFTWDLLPCSVRPSQVTLVMQAARQTWAIGPVLARPGMSLENGPISQVSSVLSNSAPPRQSLKTKQKRSTLTFWLGLRVRRAVAPGDILIAPWAN